MTPALLIERFSAQPSEPTEFFYPSQSTSWLPSWNSWAFRKSHTIEGSVGAGTNYQVRIIVHRSAGTDSGENVFVGTNCRVDFGDIRFTADDGSTLLDYWIENYYYSDNATFWVEVRDNLDSDVTIFMYYGNSAAGNLSNGTATFIFFDDFETGNFDRWDDVGSSVVIDSSTVYSGSYSAFLSGGGNERYLWKNTTTQWSTTPFMVHVAARFTYSGPFAGSPMYWIGCSNTDTLRYGYTLYGQSLSWSYVDYTGAIIPWSGNSAYSINVWYEMEGAIDVTEGKHYAWKESSYLGQAPLEPDGYSESMQNITVLLAAGGSDPGRSLLIDDFFVRKWTAVEPTSGLWSTETTPPTTTAFPVGIDPLVFLVAVSGMGGIIVVLVVLLLRKGKT